MFKKSKIDRNISDYSSHKKLLEMKKPKSPHSLVFMTKDKDGWFINCVEYKTKSGIVAHDELIIEKDMKQWIEWHKRLGWQEI